MVLFPITCFVASTALAIVLLVGAGAAVLLYSLVMQLKFHTFLAPPYDHNPVIAADAVLGSRRCREPVRTA